MAHRGLSPVIITPQTGAWASAPPRYTSLDAWRGVAALSVVLFHCGNSVVDPQSPFGRALLGGWAGVFLFFPISGYCILAALHTHENGTRAAFLTRRWRRIVLPYWGSLALAVAVALAALPFNAGSIDDLMLTPQAWASMLTLTQVFTEHRGSINPVYWSLCYEEQFYLAMSLLVGVDARTRARALAALTAAAALYMLPVWPWRLDGLFLEYWICFAVGCATYLWLHAPNSRGSAIVIGTIATAATILSRNTALGISVATAIALVVLAPHDRRLAASRAIAPLMVLGAFSYSLYLVHVPIGGRLTNLLDRLSWPASVIVPVSVSVSIAAAWFFYRAIERPAARWRSGATARSVQVGPTVPEAAACERNAERVGAAAHAPRAAGIR